MAFRKCYNPCFATRPNKHDHYICYGTVISHAIHHLVHSKSEEEAKTQFTKLREAIKNNHTYEGRDFISAFPFDYHGNEEKALLIIDNTDGCYPLVMYPEPKKSKSTRRIAFNKFLESINENIDELIQLLAEKQEWSDDLQAEIQALLPDPEPESYQ